MSPQAITFFSAMLPITELRGAIPFGIQVLKLPALTAYFWGVMGNLVPNAIILAILPIITEYAQHHSPFLNKYIQKIFHKTRSRHSDKFNQYGALFLILFVAIPIPGSGSWTGSLIAFIFGIPYWRALALVSIGVACAGLIITFSFEAIVHILKSII